MTDPSGLSSEGVQSLSDYPDVDKRIMAASALLGVFRVNGLRLLA